MTTQDEHELAYFKMQMLQAEIEMNAMIAENKNCELKGQPMKFAENHFMNLIDRHRIHHNAFPSYTGR